MLDCHLEEDDPIPLYEECHQCGENYECANAFCSNFNVHVEFCSDDCAEEYDEEFEKDDNNE